MARPHPAPQGVAASPLLVCVVAWALPGAGHLLLGRRRTGLILLSVMRGSLGSLDRVKRVVKVLGMVNATPDFGDHPAVVNGCSDLLVEVLGERGRHARSVFGTGSLPGCAALAIEAIVEVAAED